MGLKPSSNGINVFKDILSMTKKQEEKSVLHCCVPHSFLKKSFLNDRSRKALITLGDAKINF